MNLRKVGLLLGLLVCWFFVGCGSGQADWKNACGSGFSISAFGQPMDLGITAPDDFGGGIRGSFVFQDTLAYFLADRPKMKIKIVDLKNRRFVGEVPLDPNFMDFPSGIQVHGRDSIFVSDFHFPLILLINSQGEVLDTYNLYKDNLWEMPVEGFANFGLYGGLGMDFQYIPERNSFLVPLKQNDQWYFVREKKDFPAIGEYSLETRDFVRVFGKYEGLYASEENLLLPFYLSHPIVERVGDRIILSFSMDPNLYLYSLDGEYLGQKCGSIPEFVLSEPLRYEMEDYDSEGIMDYNRKNSYFGNFFYIAESDRFVRFYWKCEKGAEGACKSKKSYALVYDGDLNLLEVKEIHGVFGGDAYMDQLPFAKGFLSKQAERESDDEFILNHYYPLQ